MSKRTTKRICHRTVSLSMPKCSTPSVLKQKLSGSRDSRLSSSDGWLSELRALQKPAYMPTSSLIITQPCSTYLLVPLDSFLFLSPFLHLPFYLYLISPCIPENFKISRHPNLENFQIHVLEVRP